MSVPWSAAVQASPSCPAQLDSEYKPDECPSQWAVRNIVLQSKQSPASSQHTPGRTTWRMLVNLSSTTALPKVVAGTGTHQPQAPARATPNQASAPRNRLEPGSRTCIHIHHRPPTTPTHIILSTGVHRSSFEPCPSGVIRDLVSCLSAASPGHPVIVPSSLPRSRPLPPSDQSSQRPPYSLVVNRQPTLLACDSSDAIRLHTGGPNARQTPARPFAATGFPPFFLGEIDRPTNSIRPTCTKVRRGHSTGSQSISTRRRLFICLSLPQLQIYTISARSARACISSWLSTPTVSSKVPTLPATRMAKPTAR